MKSYPPPWFLLQFSYAVSFNPAETPEFSWSPGWLQETKINSKNRKHTDAQCWSQPWRIIPSWYYHNQSNPPHPPQKVNPVGCVMVTALYFKYMFHLWNFQNATWAEFLWKWVGAGTRSGSDGVDSKCHALLLKRHVHNIKLKLCAQLGGQIL